MATGSSEGTVRQAVDGVTFEKRFAEDEYVFPSVVYKLSSERDDAVEITIRESVPDSVEVEEIGFRQDLGAEHWAVDENTLEFERALEPGEEYTTVYAFRDGSSVHVDDLVTRPDAIEVTPEGSPVPDAQPMARSSDESPYRVSAAGGMESDDTDQPTAGGVDLGEREIEGADERDEESPTSDHSPTASDALAEKLASDIESGDVSQESIERLRASLTSESIGGAKQARLDQLEQDIASLRAYKNALEAFLDEEGSAEEIIDRFEQRLDEHAAELESVRWETEQLADELSALESRVESVDERVETGVTERADIADDVDSLRSELEVVDSRVPSYDIGERFEDVENELEEVGRFVEKLRGAFE